MMVRVSDNDHVIARVRAAFRDTQHPGDAFLQGSCDGSEPRDVALAFAGLTEWSQADAALLDGQYTALSFLSDGGFRFFLPAYLVADLEGVLLTADPVFQLTHGLSDRVVRTRAEARTDEQAIGKGAFVNPRRYGALTWNDYARARLCIFTREEAGAIVSYLEYRRDADPHGLDAQDIDAALESFWYDRAANAPSHDDLGRFIRAEDDHLRDLERRPE